MTENEIILTHIIKCRPIDLLVDKPALTVDQQREFEIYSRRRAEGEPLQYILGTCNFMGLELAVNPAVLIPRPETEQMVDLAVKHIKRNSPLGKQGTAPFILDLGTGSGNIAIALAKFVPDSKVVTVDVSARAMAVARANARDHGVEGQIEFINKDFNEYLASVAAGSQAESPGNVGFDFVISNPPYIPTSQLGSLPLDVRHEPSRALDGGEDGLNFYRIIIKYTPCLLRKGACLMMEIGDGQSDAVKMLVAAEKVFSDIEIFRDLAGRDRIIKTVLTS